MDPEITERFQIIFDRVMGDSEIDTEDTRTLSILRAEILMDFDYVKAVIRDKDEDKYQYVPESPICWCDLYYAFKKAPTLFSHTEWCDMLSVVESFKYDVDGYSLY